MSVTSGALAAAAGAMAARQAMRSSGATFASWDRTSFSGGSVSLTEGLVASAGMLGAAATVPGRGKCGALISVGAGAVAGYIDDQLEDRFPAKGKGLRGHLGALRGGKLTSGALKIALIGAGAAAGAATLADERSLSGRTVSWVTRTALIAGTANLVNLLDLRPGRAIKASAAVAAPLIASTGAASGLAAGIISTGAVCAEADLAGQTMLGDMGANAIGAGLGYSLASVRCPAVRAGALACVVGLTLASEKVSFSKVIENNSVLSRIDQFGRP
ncbi:hypothetical protein [Ancrocorticia sp.]|uniref:hypothetical protein n=1 Tax=Ancrocorticia sp. TaxID=2593684 RepID=UPI003F8F9361